MAVEGLDQVQDTSVEAKTTEREDPVAAHERKQAEVDAARKARSERLGHEVFEEKKEPEKKTNKKAAAATTTETSE